MMRVLPVVALGAAIALVGVAALLALRPETGATVDERAERLAAELRCPDCQGLSVADSPTEAAAAIRIQIGELLAVGATDAEVREHFVARYGEWILLAPSSPVAWVVPLAVVATGAAALFVWVRRRPGSPAPPAAPVDAAERQRIREELEALDA